MLRGVGRLLYDAPGTSGKNHVSAQVIPRSINECSYI